MRILAQDTGTTTGFALLSSGAVLSGSWSFATKRKEGGGMVFLRYRLQLDALVAAAGKPDAVFYEEVRSHNSVDSAHAYGGFAGTLTAWCEEHEIPYASVPVGAIKKFATGKGNAGKPEMIRAVQGWGYVVEDDNHADALALLHLKAAELDVPVPRP